jgi:CRP/FNR family transcriptional regulator, transcriptional activator FtrB
MPADSRMIGELPLFSALDAAFLGRVATIASLATFAANEHLYDVGEKARCLYALHSGQVALGTRGARREFVAVEIMRPGDVFGTGAVLLDRPTLVAAKALEESSVICIEAPALRDLLRDDPKMARAMLVSIAKDYRSLVRQVADLKSRSVAQRLGCYLLAIADEQATTEMILPFEKRLLASRLGTTPESLSRAFGVLRSCGVTTVGRRVSLRDLAGLTKFARPDEIV